MRCFNLLVLFLLSAIPSFADEVFKITPLPDAAYSSAATVDPMATLVFTKSYTGAQEDVGVAAASAFSELSDDLRAAGLSMEAVVNVRGYLRAKKGEDMSESMEKWSGAFVEAFAENELPPTRTSIGVSALPAEATVGLDVILAIDPETASKLPSVWSNDRMYEGPKPETLRGARSYSSLLVTSGVLADSLPDESGFGTMEQQTVSVLSKLDDVLAGWGVSRADLLFVRAMLSPEENEEGETTTDFSGFDAGWQSFWSDRAGNAPPLSVFSAPGFGATGRIVEIEFYAVFPDASGPFHSGSELGASLSKGPAWREGSETSFLSRSVAISRDASLTWFAGVIDRTQTDIYQQAMQSLLTLEGRLDEEGVDFSELVQLRAYLNIQDDFRSEFGEWNRAYRRFFDHSKLNPEKPVRTAFPIEELPGGALIEIEVLAVSR